MQKIHTKALKHLSLAIENDPGHIPSIALMCQTLLKEQRFREVNKALDQVSVDKKDDTEIIYIRIKLFYLTNDTSKAVNELENILFKKKLDIKFYELGLLIYKKNENFTGQQKMLEKIVDLDPSNGIAHLEFGKLINDPADFEKKKLLLEISLDLLPKNPEPAWELAKYYKDILFHDSQVLNNSEYYHNSKKYYKIGLKNDENNYQYILDLGKLEFKNYKYDNAQFEFKKLLSTVLKKDAFYFLGLIDKSKDKLKSAEDHFTKAFGSKRYKSRAMLEFCKIKIDQDDYKSANQYINKILEYLEIDENENLKISKSLSRKNDFYAARKFLKKAHTFKKMRGQAMVMKYMVLYKLEKESQSDLLHKSISVYNQNALAYYELGKIEKKLKKYENAKLYFENACNYDWDHIDSHYQLSNMEILLKNFESALYHIEIVYNINPKFKDTRKIFSKLKNS